MISYDSYILFESFKSLNYECSLIDIYEVYFI